MADFTGVSSDSSVNALYNPYAAVPSMHVGFALMLSVPMMRMTRRRWAKALWAIYAPIVACVVVVTANHWVFDAATGALAALVAAVAAQTLLARVRPAGVGVGGRNGPTRPGAGRIGWRATWPRVTTRRSSVTVSSIRG